MHFLFQLFPDSNWELQKSLYNNFSHFAFVLGHYVC